MKIFIAVLLVLLFFGLFQILFLRIFVKDWWDNKTVRKLSYILLFSGIGSVLSWKIGGVLGFDFIMYPAVVIAVSCLIFELCLILAYPFSGGIKLLNFLFDYFKKKLNTEDTPVDIHRRKVLQTVASAIPLIALTSGASGIVTSFSSVNVYKKPIMFENLPEELNGFRILHLSDLHLRHYVTLSDLEDVLIDAEKLSPDLILVTGDIADDLDLLPDALKMIDEINAPYGCYASLGNHEHFRGINAVKHLFNKSPVPLLVNRGETIQVGNSALFLGGIDDPVRMGAKETLFYQETINETFNFEHGSDFKLLMSHRPDALDYAAKIGVDLTLAGHTHGGQMGVNGRSLLEPYFPDRYLWGDYFIGKSKLYTTSGMGHWFPFRLGCPTEAVVLELTKS